MALRASADQSQQWAAQLCTICENAILWQAKPIGVSAAWPAAVLLE